MDDWAQQIHFGEICSLMSAMLWAHSVIIFRRLGEDLHALALNLFKSILGLPIFLLLALAIEPGALAHMVDFSAVQSENLMDQLGVVAILSGIVGVTLADSLFFASLNRLGAGLSATLSTLYTPAVILWSFLFLSEVISAVQLIGAGLVVVAAASISLYPGIGKDLSKK